MDSLTAEGLALHDKGMCVDDIARKSNLTPGRIVKMLNRARRQLAAAEKRRDPRMAVKKVFDARKERSVVRVPVPLGQIAAFSEPCFKCGAAGACRHRRAT